jgi:hypothetical protein
MRKSQRLVKRVYGVQRPGSARTGIRPTQAARTMALARAPTCRYAGVPGTHVRAQAHANVRGAPRRAEPPGAADLPTRSALRRLPSVCPAFAQRRSGSGTRSHARPRTRGSGFAGACMRSTPWAGASTSARLPLCVIATGYQERDACPKTVVLQRRREHGAVPPAGMAVAWNVTHAF